MPKIVKNVIAHPRGRHPRGRHHPPQRPVRRCDALAGRRDRDPDLLRGRARRLLRRARRTCSTSAAPTRASRSTSSTTGRRATSTGPSSSRRRASGRTRLWKHILDERPHARRTTTATSEAMIAACELGAKRASLELLGRYGEETRARRRPRPGSSTPSRCSARRSRRCRTAATSTEVGWLDDDGVNRGVKLPVKVAVEIDGDEITFDLTGSSDEVPTGFNCPFEGTTVSAMTFITPHDLPRRGHVPGVRPAERGDAARRSSVVAPQGLDLQPELPARLLRPVLPGAARRRPRAPRARAGDPEPDHGGQLGAPRLPRLLGLRRGGGRVLGVPRGRRGLLRRAAPAATGWTRSTA